MTLPAKALALVPTKAARPAAACAALLAALACAPAAAQDALPQSCQEALAMADATTVDRITQLSACLSEQGLSDEVRSNFHGMLGALHLQRGEDEAALRYFDLVTQRAEGEVVIDFAGFYLDRADLRSKLGRFEEALADLEIAKTIATVEDQPGVLRTESAILAREGFFEEALAAAQRMAALAPDDWTAQLNLAGSLRSVGRYDEALAAADRAIELQPEHFATHNNRCYVLLTLGDAEAALPSCERAAELGPGSWQVADSYAAVLAALGRAEEAAREYERAIALAPERERPALEQALAALAPPE